MELRKGGVVLVVWGAQAHLQFNMLDQMCRFILMGLNVVAALLFPFTSPCIPSVYAGVKHTLSLALSVP
jgi:hypothetical protein